LEATSRRRGVLLATESEFAARPILPDSARVRVPRKCRSWAFADREHRSLVDGDNATLSLIVRGYGVSATARSYV